MCVHMAKHRTGGWWAPLSPCPCKLLWPNCEVPKALISQAPYIPDTSPQGDATKGGQGREERVWTLTERSAHMAVASGASSSPRPLGLPALVPELQTDAITGAPFLQTVVSTKLLPSARPDLNTQTSRCLGSPCAFSTRVCDFGCVQLHPHLGLACGETANLSFTTGLQVSAGGTNGVSPTAGLGSFEPPKTAGSTPPNLAAPLTSPSPAQRCMAPAAQPCPPSSAHCMASHCCVCAGCRELLGWPCTPELCLQTGSAE